MGKEPGPLEKVTKDGDALRKQVDKIVKESLKNANNKKLKDKEIKLKANFRSCFELKPQVTALLQKAEELSEENEEKKQQKNFETKKKKEVDRITVWQTQLDDAMTKLLPEDEKETYEKELKKELGLEDGEEEEEKEDEEQSDEEGDTTMAETGKTEGEDEDDEEGEEDGDDDEDDEDEEEDIADKDETLKNPTSKDEGKMKAKPKEEIDEEEVSEEEVEEEEVEEEIEEEETEEEEEEEEEEEKSPKKVEKTKPQKKKTADEEDDEEEEDEEEDEEDEDEDEEESEEEEDEEGQTTLEVTTTGRLFEALYDFKSEEKGDLNFKKGEILTIMQTQEDGWWQAENESGEKGSVPSTYLKMHNKYKDVQQDDEEEEEEDEEEEEEKEGEEEGQEEEEETTEGGKGKKRAKRQRSGKELWKNVRKAVNETSVTDVLHALGAVPSGFRHSTLGQKFNSESTYQMKNYLTPKLSSSNFSYRDLFFDPSENKIRAKLVREQRIVTLAGCRQIPVPGAGLEITSRHVRMCLFDGQNVLSNIHTVKVASVDRDQRTWSFTTRINDMMDTFQHAEVFVRTDVVQKNLGVLFELCASYERTSTKEHGEFSCGWTHLPFEDPVSGLPIQNKSHDLPVNGGTPYEKGVEVDPSISRRTSSNAFMSFISGNKQPRLVVKLSLPKKDQKDMLDTLPDTLVGNTSLLQLYMLHRQQLADALLRDRLDLESTEMIHSPWLTTLPLVADQHDLMKLLRETWLEKLKSVRRAEMRDAEYIKDVFKKAVMESVYPLLHSATLPPYKSGDFLVQMARNEEIDKFKQQKLAKRSILALLLSSDLNHKPVDMKEVSYNVIGPYCLTQHSKTQVSVES